MSIYDVYEIKERKLKMYYDSLLLAEIILLNSRMNMKKYDDSVSVSTIYETLQDTIPYTLKEKSKIISTARNIIEEKYCLEIIDYDKLIFKDSLKNK